MAKCRKKEVMGIPVTSPDGAVWTWQIGQTRYTWCVVGQVRIYNAEGECRILLHSKRIEGAVGYTMGFADGVARGRAIPKEGEGGEGPGSS